MELAIIIALYLLGMVVVVAENASMPARALLGICIVWPAAALAALILGTISWLCAGLRK